MNFIAVLVAELPALRPGAGSGMDGAVAGAGAGSIAPSPAAGIAAASPSPSPKTPASPAAGGGGGGGVQPRVVLTLPPLADTKMRVADILNFCFPDLEQLQKMPFHFDHSTEEFVFTLTNREGPRVHGFVRRFRVPAPVTSNRLDISPYTSANAKDAATSTLQCICILSER